MNARPLKLEHALKLLPEVERLKPMREALVGASREEFRKIWAGSADYATLDTRVADMEKLAEEIPSLVEAVVERTQRIYEHTLLALRALQQGRTVDAAQELVHAGEAAESSRLLSEARQFYARAAEVGRKPRDRRVEGLARRRLGRVARAMGDWVQGVNEYSRGLEIAEAMGDVEGMVVACQGLGNIAHDRGSWQEARRWYERGISLLDQDSPSRQLWELYSNLATVEMREGRTGESGELLARAEEVVAALGDEAGAVFLENGRGRLLSMQSLFPEAEAAYRRALEAAGDPTVQAYVLINLAEAVMAQGRLDEAVQLARLAEDVAVAERSIGALPEIYRILGEISRRRRSPDGFVFFEQALDLHQEFGLPAYQLALTQHRYAGYEEALGNVDAAHARYETAVQLLRELGAGPELARAEADLQRLRSPEGRTSGEHPEAV